LTGLYALSSGTGLIVPVVCALVARRLGASSGTPGPHDFAVRIVLFVRVICRDDLHRRTASHFVLALSGADHALTLQPDTPPHPRLNVRDGRETPLNGSGMANRSTIYEKAKEKFSR
jgi:hypothetical protein